MKTAVIIFVTKAGVEHLKIRSQNSDLSWYDLFCYAVGEAKKTFGEKIQITGFVKLDGE